MVGHGKVPNDEPVTELVESPGLPVHDSVFQDDLIREIWIHGKEGLDRVSDLVLHQIANSLESGADLFQILLQAFFVTCHGAHLP